MMKFARLLALSATLLLAACASGPRVIDALVTTQAAHPPGSALLQQPRYRFVQTETVVGGPDAAQIEAMAEQALARVGAVRDDAAARLSVQVAGRVGMRWSDEALYGGPSNPQMALGLGFDGWRGGGWGFGFGWPGWGAQTPIYLSETTMVMRDLQSGQIVYDTRARHEGVQGDTTPVLAALFVAGLEGYPAPAQSVRRVSVPIFPVAPD